MLGQKLTEDGGRDAGLVELAIQVQAGRDDGRLDRVQHVETVGQLLAKTVPLAGLFARVVAQNPVVGATNAFVVKLLWAPHLEPPIVAVFGIDFAHGTAEIQRFGNAFFDQCRTAGWLHHGSSNVAAGDDAVLRAGAGVHQIGLVEQGAVQLDVLRVLHQHMAGLTDTGQQFVNRLRGVDHAVFGPCPFFPHRVVRAIKRVESRVRQPSLVKVQVFHITVQHVLDGLGVVEHAVVGGLGQGHHARFDFFRVYALEQWVGFDLGHDGRRLKFAFGNRANDAEMVACGLHEDRHRAGHDDGVQDGLVAVAIDHHHIARGHGVVPHNFVRRAGAIGDKEAMVGIKNAGSVALTLANRAIVVQQLAQLFHRVADVSAQHVFTIKLVVHLAHWAFQKGHATRVTRAVPRIRTVFGVIEQSFEKRRLHTLQIAFGLANDVACHKLGRVFKHVNKAMQLAQDVIGQVARCFGFTVDVDWHIGIFAAHFVNEGAQIDHRRVQIRSGRELLVIDRQDEGTGAALLLRELRQITVTGHTQNLKALADNGIGQSTNAQARGVFGAVIFVNDDDGKAKFHGLAGLWAKVGQRDSNSGEV